MDFPIEKFLHIYDDVQKNVQFKNEVLWQDSLQPCTNANEFAMQAMWVVLNSGMKNQIAKLIFDRIVEARQNGTPIEDVFRHKDKTWAIKYLLINKDKLYQQYLDAAALDKQDGSNEVKHRIAFLQTLPFIGKITCWHLAKNLGVNCVKPDRHLVRLANQYETTPEALCSQIGAALVMKVCVVDLVLWRACNLGWL